MRARAALRAALLTATTALLVLPASAAFATQPTNTYDDGDQPGAGLTVLQTLLIFVGIPALVFVVIVLLVNAGSASRGPRYRPGVGWWAAPIWFNGPDNAERAVREAAGLSNQGGGASARW
ncbi:MAG: aa3-type cytochrome oxidase subunit CtaJ [Actinomycetes bacterium]